MAEPVEDDVSFLGIQEGADHNSPRVDQKVSSSEYSGSELQTSEPRTSGVLRAFGAAAQARLERKNSIGRTLPGGGADRSSPYSSSSPIASPRTPDRSPNYNIDASGSTYALQVALRNMKERYHKLQKKMALIEDDNQRLISGKSELFGEIGKLQENSIKLREKNLQLNQEIHSKHQECCSLKEKFSALSTENMNLTRQLARNVQENRRLNKQLNFTNEENKRLREKLSLISAQVKLLPGGASLAASASELSAPPKTKIVPLSEELDSFSDPPSRFLSSHKETLDEFEQISSSELADIDSWGDSSSEELLSSMQSATRRMKDLMVNLQEQNHSLMLLSPFLRSIQSPLGSQSGGDNHPNSNTLSRDGTATLGQRDRDLSSVTVSPSAKGFPGTLQDLDDEGNCQSRLATCGSVVSPTYISAGAINTSPITNDSGGDNNIHIDGHMNGDRPQSPFDWRQVQVSDDEGKDNDAGRPDMRTVSTSPVPGLEDEEDRICPMCNACFPRVIPQESFESHVVSHFEVENGFEVIA